MYSISQGSFLVINVSNSPRLHFLKLSKISITFAALTHHSKMPPKKITKPTAAPSRPRLARGAKTTAASSDEPPPPTKKATAKKAPASKKAAAPKRKILVAVSSESEASTSDESPPPTPPAKKVAFNRDPKPAPLKKTTKNTAKSIEKRPPTPGLKPGSSYTTTASSSGNKKPRGRPAKVHAPAPTNAPAPAAKKAPQKGRVALSRKGKERAQTPNSESERAPGPSGLHSIPRRDNAAKTAADYAEEVIQQMNEYQQKLVDGHAKMHREGKAVCAEGKCPGFEPFPKLEFRKIFPIGRGGGKWMKTPYPEGLEELVRDGNRIIVPEGLRGVLEEGEDPFEVLRGLGGGQGQGEEHEGSRSRGKAKTLSKASGSKEKTPAKGAKASGSGSGVKKTPGSPKSLKKTPGKSKGPER
ncbi:hypothetical protein BDZ45DRAFT_756318 [Acephala macrosclerotiorum]|nr:hypothetical protein BDZ45DRAFT_756318 [Acephala macrosclerotiorum]